MKLYDYKTFDAYWQKKWEESNLYETPRLPGEKKVYVLDMFPYPSGEGLHVGHPKGYIATDIYSRFKRMSGYDVLHPMGWDAFGLPAEQFALKHKVQPRVAVEKNIANFKQQLSHLGLDYDWKREVNTTDPEFYKWTQWIFTKLYEKGLAYESHEPINWCPTCKTGLANEDLNGNLCERCDSVVEKKPLRQWVLKITDYADRMIKDLDDLAWPEGIKTAQKNWIGRSEGAEFDFKLEDGKHSVKVFTTRADTLFGATFIAISAELASSWFNEGLLSGAEVKEYITTTLEEMKKENDYSVVPEKTGVFSGMYAINPATKEKIPVWIANYVVGGVGTGALMAVPAHDERDYEFAKKYNLPIKQVVIEKAILTGEDAPRDSAETLHRKVVDVILENKQGQFLLVIEDKKHFHFIGGGVEEGDTELASVYKETEEESGYTDIKVDEVKFSPQAVFGFRHTKQKNQDTLGFFYHATLNSENKIPCEVEAGHHEIGWFEKDAIADLITWPHHKKAWLEFLKKKEVSMYSGYGVLVNSEQFDSLTSEEAKAKIIDAFGGKKVVRYKLQDWVFARQRYWGEPFPVVRDEAGKVYMVDESELPVLLPQVDQYEPTGTGESPLAAITDWVNVKGYITDSGTFKQSEDGKNFTRETNTMPQWAGSSWYYLRFLDPHNKNALVDKEIEKAWGEVNVYVGGDHATRHLIYARFWHKFLYDIGAVSTNEPFARLEFLGFILAEDGRKMSKRWGNIINPDDVVSEYGADTLRVYEMFMAPFEQTASWSTSSIKGSDKFLDRVYALKGKIGATTSVEVELHKTIKKVGEDIENFKFNTAVSSMMILVNSMESGSFTKADYCSLLKLLAPFAPHITEQVWHELGNETFIHKEMWPTYDEYKLVEGTVTLAIQIAGKMRGTIEIARDSEDSLVVEAVKNHEMYKKYVGENEPKKVIIVKNKIVNIVL
jgi:leucyl-tRNA synthetase